jgi:protein involved in polysaccharide export with SLBB domain
MTVGRHAAALWLILFAASGAGHAPLAGQQAAEGLRRSIYLYPGDVVELRVWREPEFSGQFLVDERGTVVLPRLGRLTVTDQPMDELREKLLSEFGRFLRNPSVDVVFLRRITVLGAVRNPGLYRIDPTLTVADVLAMAGGPMPEGRTDRIHIVRDGVQLESMVTEGTRLGESEIRPGDQLFVPERRWISRNPAVAVSVLSGLVSIAVAFLIR